MEENQNLVETATEVSTAVQKKGNKKLPIIIVVVMVVIGVLAVFVLGGSNKSYETAYDNYCKAVLSFDGQTVLDACPDSYVKYFCDNLDVTEEDMADTITQYMIKYFNNSKVMDISELQYDEYEFLSVSSSSEVSTRDFDYLSYPDRELDTGRVETIRLREFIMYCQYPHYATYFWNSIALSGKYKDYHHGDIEGASEASDLSSQMYESIPSYLEEDIESCEQVKVVFQTDGNPNEVVCYKIYDNWYAEDLLEFTLQALKYIDVEYPEDKKPEELQGVDESVFAKLEDTTNGLIQDAENEIIRENLIDYLENN